VVLTLINTTHATLYWQLTQVAPPLGTPRALAGLAELTTTSTGAVFTPNNAGPYTVTLDGYAAGGALEASYSLLLGIADVAVTMYLGPVGVPSVAGSLVLPSALAGETIYFDEVTKLLTAKNTAGLTRTLEARSLGTVTGHRSTGAALVSLLGLLAAYGMIVDESEA
jgi:hypothetical protein